jgi:hypothetical protein
VRPLDERGGKPSGSRAYLEGPPPAQIAEANEGVEELPPIFVDRPELVVARGPTIEVEETPRRR